MKAVDFILQTRADLQEKSEHWRDEELLIKLQRCYVSLQFDLPFFITSKLLEIEKGITEYYLDMLPLKNISFKMKNDASPFTFASIENFYAMPKDRTYTFSGEKIIINTTLPVEGFATLVCRYQKEISTTNCEIELPANYHKALRLLFLSEIHEKPTRNTKERVLSTHYIKLYDKEIYKLKTEQKTRPKNVTSNYQRI
ncbi:MAG: hypothetical protein IBX43_04940 [Campylobacterales bacterium]|nr:hypothetical protein [Campylobacterales bacterium]